MYRRNMSCSLCLDEQTEENENHLLCCPFVARNIQNDITNVKYEDVFKDINKQKMAVKTFKQIMNLYEKQKKMDPPGAS